MDMLPEPQKVSTLASSDCQTINHLGWNRPFVELVTVLTVIMLDASPDGLASDRAR